MAILSKTNITTTAVGNALGSGSRDVGTLCTHPNIKMWSRMKPVRIANAFPDRTPSKKWWTGDRGNCGIDTANASTDNYSMIPSLYTQDKHNGYEYHCPLGGENSPFRLADFQGYKNDAKPPIHSFSCTEKIDKTYSTIHGQVAYTATEFDKTQPGNLSLDEIGGFVVDGEPKTLGDMFFGIAICNNVGEIIRLKTTDGKLGDIVELDGSGMKLGTYKVYPFLCTRQQIGLSSIRAYYFTLPEATYSTLQVVSSLVSIYNEAEMQYDEFGERKSVYYKVRVSQDAMSSMTFKNNTITLYYNQVINGRITEQQVDKHDLQDVVVKKGEICLVGEGFLGYKEYGHLDKRTVYHLRLSLGQGAYKRDFEPKDIVQP